MQRARGAVYWPNLNSDIKELIWNYETCGKFSKDNQKEPLILKPISKYPWKYLGFDFCKVKGRDYLITGDYYSRFIEIDRVNPVTSEETINKLKSHFAKYGIPENIRSDNGPQFTLDEFHRVPYLGLFKNQNTQMDGIASSAELLKSGSLRSMLP